MDDHESSEHDQDLVVSMDQTEEADDDNFELEKSADDQYSQHLLSSSKHKFTRCHVNNVKRHERDRLSSSLRSVHRLVLYALAVLVRSVAPKTKPSTRGYERATLVEDDLPPSSHRSSSGVAGHTAAAPSSPSHFVIRCFMPQNFRFLHLLVIVFFFLFFVIQFKPLPLMAVPSGALQSLPYDYQQQQQQPQQPPSSSPPRWYQQHLSSFRDLFDVSWRDKDSNASSKDRAYGLDWIVNSTQSSEPCPLVPTKLVGKLKVLLDPPPMEKMETELAGIEAGGRYRPRQCMAKDKVAIIVPYRNRQQHLLTFLWNLHPMLMRQNIDYAIYIVEQDGTDAFNRAKLMNIGYLEALKQYAYDCFIFHDIDLLPEDDRNLYTCPQQPRHMSVAVDKFRYRLPYADIFGGVSALTTEQFRKVNGFSNEFWGWGGEDDDMSNRIRHYKYKITRYPAHIARYKMLKHSQQPTNEDRYKKLYNGWRRFKKDGITNVKYKVKQIVHNKLYTWILVDVFPPKKN